MIVSSTWTYSVFNDVAEIDVDIFDEQHLDLLWHGFRTRNRRLNPTRAVDLGTAIS